MSFLGRYDDDAVVDLGMYRGSGVRVLCPDRGDYVQGTIRQSGRLWNQDALAYTLRYVPQSAHVVDVGGYTGSSALWFARMAGACVTVIEPDVHSYGLLRDNIVLNGVSDAVRTVHAAVWDSDCLARASYRSASNLGATQFRPCTEFGGDAVPAFCLDTLLAGSGRIDVLYLSMEGYEYRALRGARGVVSAFRPVISITMWPPTQVCCDTEYDCLAAYVSLVHELAELGYVLAGGVWDTAVYAPKEVYPWAQ